MQQRAVPARFLPCSTCSVELHSHRARGVFPCPLCQFPACSALVLPGWQPIKKPKTLFRRQVHQMQVRRVDANQCTSSEQAAARSSVPMAFAERAMAVWLTYRALGSTRFGLFGLVLIRSAVPCLGCTRLEMLRERRTGVLCLNGNRSTHQFGSLFYKYA